jgi:large subunit ribosomal protein L30
MNKVRITQTKSTIDRPKTQKLTIQSLGLGRINKSVEVICTPQIQGMIDKVQHLIEVKQIEQ